MDSRKSVGPRMDSWGTPALTGHSCEDIPSRTTQSCLLLRKEEIRPIIWPEIPYDLSLQRRQACQTLSKDLDISSATAQVAPNLSKALVILSDTTVRTSPVDREDLKPYWKLETILPQFSRSLTIPLITSSSKILLSPERRLIGW